MVRDAEVSIVKIHCSLTIAKTVLSRCGPKILPMQPVSARVLPIAVQFVVRDQAAIKVVLGRNHYRAYTCTTAGIGDGDHYPSKYVVYWRRSTRHKYCTALHQV